jgi:hypothetical protein
MNATRQTCLLAAGQLVARRGEAETVENTDDARVAIVQSLPYRPKEG